MSKRFKLLFLAENEEYLKDVGCAVKSQLIKVDDSGKIPDGPINSLVRGYEFRGRLRIGSFSLVLDLEGLDDFVSIPLDSIMDVASLSDESIRVRASRFRVIPVSSIGSKTRLVKPMYDQDVRVEVSFTIHGSYLPDVLKVLKGLFYARGSSESRKSFLSSISGSMDSAFDLTSLSSHREVLLLPKPLRVTRIKKMLEVPGIIHVSKHNVYFQPRATFGPRKVKKFALTSFGTSTVSSLRLQRYKLKDTCLELQFNSGKTLLLQFENKTDREVFVNSLQTTQSPGISLTPKLPTLSRATELWRTCSISNFDYIMYLNFLAGRSVNDIGQYPIFPWTVSDMTCMSLDVTDETKFRDLSQPIAATNKTRLEQARTRALQMPATERFLFGSFYSNPAFVLYFLIRKYPECHLRLHGGHFDHTARLFTSLKGAWEAIADSGSATMELIPEFYSDFEGASSWLRNLPTMNHIPEVRLPDWASSPSDFVIKMRCALESPVVSEKLHLWIDLVLGVQSRSREICFNNNNLFHPVCYLTDVETDVVDYCHDNEAQKNIVLLQSQEFGHVPTQLFPTECHPERDLKKLKPEWYSDSFYRNGGGRESWRSVLAQF